MKDYTYLDQMSDEEVAEFKEEAIERQEVFGGVSPFSKSALSERPQIVSEGDSWFDYFPGTDLIDCLRRFHGYSIKNYGNAGDTLENMVYGTQYKKDSFQATEPTVFKVLRKVGQIKPKIFLFSGGGNDIAGDEFGSFLNHAETGLPALRTEYIDYMVGTVFKKCCEDMIRKVAEVSPNTHMVMHGYGYSVPTGRAVSILGFRFSGPWLRPALTAKRIIDPSAQYLAVKHMIDSYNAMLAELDARHAYFHHVDLRPIIDPDNDWANELHLRNSAYARAADKINDVISQIN